eukprot:Tamp_04006.p1 GENE.Tamp_04006~~Tamp_04006.p1  ORF type:complete len:1126 (-),score=147.17 Tamp_04006:93-3317(-)
MALKGGLAMTLNPLQICSKASDCAGADQQCWDSVQDNLANDIPDVFQWLLTTSWDELVDGSSQERDAHRYPCDGEPSIPPAATVPTFSRNSTNLLAFVPAEIIRRCPNENSAGRCGCQDDPYVKFDCPLGDATCGCYRCPESLGSSFILHEGLCFEACPDDTPVDHHPVFFESADPAVADQAPSMTYSPWSAPIKETDAKLVSTVCSDSCTWGCVPCEWPNDILKINGVCGCYTCDSGTLFKNGKCYNQDDDACPTGQKLHCFDNNCGCYDDGETVELVWGDMCPATHTFFHFSADSYIADAGIWCVQCPDGTSPEEEWISGSPMLMCGNVAPTSKVRVTSGTVLQPVSVPGVSDPIYTDVPAGENCYAARLGTEDCDSGTCRCRKCPSGYSPDYDEWYDNNRRRCKEDCSYPLQRFCPNDVCGCYAEGSHKVSAVASMACPPDRIYQVEGDQRKCVAPKPKLGVCANCLTGSMYAPRGLGLAAIEAARCIECSRRRAGARRAGQCDSSAGENKFVADVLSYFTGQPAANQKFGFCLPTGVDFSETAIETAFKEEKFDDQPNKISLALLAPYSGVLPGVSDQPSLSFAFPPSGASAYTWPQEKEKTVQWVAFNFPKNSKVSITLLKGGSPVTGSSYPDLPNNYMTKIKMPASTAVGTGYAMRLCALVPAERCWTSGAFAVVPKIENQKPPAPHKQLLPGDASIFTDADGNPTEARAVFIAAQIPNIAMTVDLPTHCIEITGLASVTTSRRSSGIQVSMLLHPDDTGQSDFDPAAKAEQLADPDLQKALVANSAAFTASAQSSDASVSELSSDAYSDVAAFEDIKAQCDKGNCKIEEISLGTEESKGWWTTLRIVAVSVGGGVGLLCCCGGAAAFFMMGKGEAAAAPQPQAKVSGELASVTPAQAISTDESAAGPRDVEMPAPQEETPEDEEDLCPKCSTSFDGGRFCPACGNPKAEPISATALGHDVKIEVDQQSSYKLESAPVFDDMNMPESAPYEEDMSRSAVDDVMPPGAPLRTSQPASLQAGQPGAGTANESWASDPLGGLSNTWGNVTGGIGSLFGSNPPAGTRGRNMD